MIKITENELEAVQKFCEVDGIAPICSVEQGNWLNPWPFRAVGQSLAGTTEFQIRLLQSLKFTSVTER
jgi:hypothetical protein